jgi:hypothetical protein
MVSLERVARAFVWQTWQEQQDVPCGAQQFIIEGGFLARAVQLEHASLLHSISFLIYPSSPFLLQRSAWLIC